jgi:hypothetical protein
MKNVVGGWNNGTMEQWNNGTMEQWNNGTMEQWNNGTMEQWGNKIFGHFGPWRSYLKMALKNDFFDFFQPLCFWKAEIELEINLLEFLGSEVI